MAQYDGSIIINTLINTLGLRRGVSDIREQLGGLSGTAKKLGAVLASVFAVGKLVQFGKTAIELGSDLQEVQNVVDVTFTTMSEKVNEFAKNAAISAGLSETMAKQYIGTFGAMSKSFGFAENEAYEMSAALTQLAGDVASFYNISQDEAYTKLKSVFTGETETLKELGVVMTQTALDQYALANGFGKTTNEMTEQEKVALRYRFVMEQLAGASGDFIRTSDGWANQVRVLKLQFDSLKATIGQGLINVFTPVIKTINILLGKLSTAANAFKSFTELVMGKKASSGENTGLSTSEFSDMANEYNSIADAADELAKSTDKVADATKKAKKEAEGYLSPLDEINKFNTKNLDSEDIGIGGIEGKAENIDYGKVEEGETILDKLGNSIGNVVGKLKELAEIFKQGFWNGLGDWQYRWDSVKDSIASIKESLKNIFTDPEVIAALKKWVESIAYMLGSMVGSTASIGLTIATNLLDGIATYLEQNQERIKNYLISMFNVRAEVNYMFSDLFQSIAYVFEAFASENGQRLTANVVGIFANAFMGVTELSSKIGRDVLKIFIQPFVDNKEAFRTALEGFLGVLADVAGTIKESIDATFNKLNEVYDAHFKPFFDSVAQGLSYLVGQFMSFWNESVQPVLQHMADGFDKLFKQHIQPLINDAIELFGKIADLFKMIWEEILVPFIDWCIQNILPKILPIIQGVYDSLMEAFGGAIDIFDSIINKLSEFVDWLIGHKEIIEDFIIIIGSFIAAFAAVKLITAISGIVSALTTLEGAIAALTVVTNLLGGAMVFLTSPFTLLVAAIGAVIAAFVLLYKHSEKFRDFVNGIVDAAKEIIPGIIKGIGDGLADLGECIKNLGEKILNGFKDFFGIHSPSTVMYEQASMLMQGVMNGIDAHKDSVNRIWESMKNAITGTWSSVKESTSSAWDSIKQNSSQKWNNISQDIGGKLNEIKNKFSNFNINSSATWKNLWNGMVSAINGPINTIKNTVNTAFNWISDKVKTLTKKLNDLSKKSSGLSKGSSSSTKNISLKSKGFSLDYGPALSAPVSQAFASLSNKDFPGYATGQVIPRTMKQHLAWLGDNNKETEVVSPLSTIEQAVVNAMNRSGSGEITIKIPIYLDGKKITEAVVNYGKMQQMSTGNNIFNLE